jgi:hypothetical protein
MFKCTIYNSLLNLQEIEIDSKEKKTKYFLLLIYPFLKAVWG